MLQFPCAKINLGLNVISKREDGYHNIKTCMYPIPLYDALEIIQSDSFSFTTTGIEIPGKEEDNLCTKAYFLLQKKFGISPVKIHLHKSIPMGAGLGGGSSDGAYTLKILNQLFDLKISNEQLEKYALILGSDCPFFITSQSVIATNRGERMTPFPISLKGYYLALQSSKIKISTPWAYEHILAKSPRYDLEEILKQPLSQWDNLKNDFEENVFAAHPTLSKTKEMMLQEGAIYSAMTGSGATVFGIFRSPPTKREWRIIEL